MNNGGGNGGGEQAQMMNLLQVFSRQRKKYIPLPWDDVVGLRVDFPGLADILAALDHGGLTGLGDDDHTIYAKLLGRAGGQVLYGGTASGNKLFLRGSSAVLTDLVNLQAVEFDDTGSDPTLAGTIYRNGVKLVWHDGTAARRIAMLDNSNPSDAQILVNNGTIWVPKSLSGDITIDNTGASTIGADKVTTAKILDANVTRAKIASSERLWTEAVQNPSLWIWQRGTSGLATANTYTADGFLWNTAGTAHVVTFARSTEVPTGVNVRYSMQISQGATTDGSMDAGDLSIVKQWMEGDRFAQFRNKTFTVSFYIRTPAGTYGFFFGSGNGDRRYVSEVVVSAGEANTWVRKTVTITHSDSAGTWSYVEGTAGLQYGLVLMGGANYQGAAGAWTNDTDLTTSNQFNFAATNGNVMYLTAFQFDLGSEAADYRGQSYRQSLRDCEYYFRTICTGATQQRLTTGQCYSTTNAEGTFTFPKMRTTPTITIANPTSFSIYNAAGSGTAGSGAGLQIPSGTTANSAPWDLTVASGLVAGNAGQLLTNNTNAQISLSAEFS